VGGWWNTFIHSTAERKSCRTRRRLHMGKNVPSGESFVEKRSRRQCAEVCLGSRRRVFVTCRSVVVALSGSECLAANCTACFFHPFRRDFFRVEKIERKSLVKREVSINNKRFFLLLLSVVHVRSGKSRQKKTLSVNNKLDNGYQ
jgi:hypothetical protein